MNFDLTILITFVLYLCFMVGIGAYFYGKNVSTEEYFLGGRKLGSWVTSMSAQASDMSGWLLMGLPGAAYLSGLSASWIAIGLAIGTYLNWLFVAKRLRQYTKVSGDAITIPQFLTHRYRDKSGVLGAVCALFILIFFLFYTASGFVAAAKLFSSVFGIPYLAALVMGALVVICYTFAGGFFAVCWTDFFQGILMFFAILIVPAAAILNLGGPADFIGMVEAFNVNMLNMFTDASGVTLSAIAVISSLAWGLGYFGQPHILVRFMGIRTPDDVKKSRRIAMIWVAISLTAAVLVGLVGRFYLPQIVSSETVAMVDAAGGETIYITMVLNMFPKLLAGILLSAILAAIMSTADSQLLVTSSAITEDFYHAKFHKSANDKELMWVSRGTVVVVAVIAAFIATDPNSSVLGLVEYAWAGFGATFGPLILCSLFWKRTNLQGAFAGVIVGGLTAIIWKQIGVAFGGIFSLYEIVPGFVLGLIAIFAVSLMTPAPGKEIEQEFDAYANCKD